MNYEGMIKITRSSGYTKPYRQSPAHIIIPDRLPLKLDIRGRRILLNVGEFAVLPPFLPCAFASAVARDVISFDFTLLADNPEFTFLLPVLSFPYICRSERPAQKELSKSFGRIIPVFDKSRAQKEAVPESVTPIDIARAMTEYHGIHGPFTATALNSLFNALFCLIGEDIAGAIKESEPGFGEDGRRKLGLAINFINDHFSEPIDLKETAKEAGYNHAHLSHIFKKIYGISLYDYLIYRRVNNAAKLICEVSLPTSEIASSSGFSSSSTFNRCFLGEFGLSPRDFAKLPDKETPPA